MSLVNKIKEDYFGSPSCIKHTLKTTLDDKK